MFKVMADIKNRTHPSDIIKLPADQRSTKFTDNKQATLIITPCLLLRIFVRTKGKEAGVGVEQDGFLSEQIRKG